MQVQTLFLDNSTVHMDTTYSLLGGGGGRGAGARGRGGSVEGPRKKTAI
jgi:hypothetical protein